MLGKAAKHLSERGHKVGLITNDQASELVDTRFLFASNTTAEVSGSCFCCNFHGFTDAICQLREQGAQAIVAEPVGSCTDLSATIMQPLKERLGEIMAAETAGTHMLTDIDYDTYAEGEAVLGWLNATVSLEAANRDWTDFLSELLGALSRRFDSEGRAVGHVKALIAESGNFVVGNFTGKHHTLKIRGESNRSQKVTLTLNARVGMPPEELEAAVREELAKLTGKDVKAEITVLKCLSPGRPNPTYRYDHIV